jgi:hypothetical protein
MDEAQTSNSMSRELTTTDSSFTSNNNYNYKKVNKQTMPSQRVLQQ